MNPRDLEKAVIPPFAVDVNASSEIPLQPIQLIKGNEDEMAERRSCISATYHWFNIFSLAIFTPQVYFSMIFVPHYLLGLLSSIHNETLRREIPNFSLEMLSELKIFANAIAIIMRTFFYSMLLQSLVIVGFSVYCLWWARKPDGWRELCTIMAFNCIYWIIATLIAHSFFCREEFSLISRILMGSTQEHLESLGAHFLGILKIHFDN